MTRPRFAVITTAYNAEAFVGETILSVRRQTVDDWTHIVVDDGSTDGTAAIVRDLADRDPRLVLVRQSNTRLARARNNAYAMVPADVPYVIFLDADDVWHPRCLESLAAALEANPVSPAAHGMSECIDVVGAVIEHTGRERFGRRYVRSRFALRMGRGVAVLGDDQPTTFDALALANPISTPGQVLLRTECLGRSEPFDPAVGSAEDWDLWLALADGEAFAFVPDVVIGYRQHGANATGNLEQMRSAELNVRYKLLSSAAVSDETRSVARRGTRAAEGERVLERLGEAWRKLRAGSPSGASREILRAGRSASEVLRSFLPWRWVYSMRLE